MLQALLRGESGLQSQLNDMGVTQVMVRALTSPGSDAIFEALQVYAWGRVCFSAWDEVLERGGRLLGYDRWAPEARGVLHALYPAFFVFSAASKLTGPNAPTNPRRRQALQALMAAVCLLLSVVGARRGERLRLGSR